jgi:hypothetical protein
MTTAHAQPVPSPATSGVPSADVTDDLPTVPLDVVRSTAGGFDFGRVAGALDVRGWLGAGAEAEEPNRARVSLDIGVGLDPATTIRVRKAALVDIGSSRVGDGEIRLDVAWRAATFAPLFPVFAGELVITPQQLGLHGRYAPPFGRFGLLIDRALLHLIAVGTATTFLARVEAALSSLDVVSIGTNRAAQGLTRGGAPACRESRRGGLRTQARGTGSSRG